MRIALSHRVIRNAVCPIDRHKIDFFDTVHRGLMLEVRASGRKTFYQRYSDPRGREHQFRLGPADVLTLKQAREFGRKVVARALLGENPQVEREHARSIPTFAEYIAERYIEYARTHKRSWKTDETVLRLHVLPYIGRKFLDEITSADVAAIVSAAGKKKYAPGTINRIVVLVRYSFGLAKKWDIPGAPKENPGRGFALLPDVQRQRFLNDQETKSLLSALSQDPNRTAANAIKLLLLTGARRNEITQAKWEYVDWKNGTLLVPLSKSGKPRQISLNSVALSLLRSLPRQGVYIFPSSVTGRPSSSLHFPWMRIRKKAGLSDVRLHDLRHSFASILVNKGVSLFIVQGLLGHAHPKATQRYAHLVRNTLSEAAEIVGQAVVSD